MSYRFTSSANSQSVISYSSLRYQDISAKSVDGQNSSDMRGQQFPNGVDCGQLSIAGNGNGFHEEMGAEKMGDHLNTTDTNDRKSYFVKKVHFSGITLVVLGTYLACRRIIYLLYCTKLRSVYFSSSLRAVQGTQRSNVEHAPMDHVTAGCANLPRKNFRGNYIDTP